VIKKTSWSALSVRSLHIVFFLPFYSNVRSIFKFVSTRGATTRANNPAFIVALFKVVANRNFAGRFVELLVFQTPPAAGAPARICNVISERIIRPLVLLCHCPRPLFRSPAAYPAAVLLTTVNLCYKPVAWGYA
jgi:hypothetical protein